MSKLLFNRNFVSPISVAPSLILIISLVCISLIVIVNLLVYLCLEGCLVIPRVLILDLDVKKNDSIVWLESKRMCPFSLFFSIKVLQASEERKISTLYSFVRFGWWWIARSYIHGGSFPFVAFSLHQICGSFPFCIISSHIMVFMRGWSRCPYVRNSISTCFIKVCESFCFF